MNVREEALADVRTVIEGIERLVAHAEQIVDGGELDGESRTLLDMVVAMSGCFGELMDWLEVAEPAGALWEAFLAAHPELRRNSVVDDDGPG